MPNHTTNVLRISAYSHEGAPEGLIDEIVAAVKGGEGDEERAFDFERLIPMPPDLKITSGSVVNNAVALVSDNEARTMLSWWWVKAEKIRNIADLRSFLRKRYLEHPEEGFKTLDDFLARVLSNKEKYGAVSWYEWSLDHWGTKWNAYSVTGGKTHKAEAIYHFETAWAPPLPVIDELAKKFPTAHIRLIWSDEGDDVAHRVYWAKGEREHDEEDEE